MRNTEIISNYQLRYAAGQYWLLNMAQKGMPYQSPIALNAMGAEIWTRFTSGQSIEQIAEELGREYEVFKEEILEDVRLFFRQLKEQGVITEE